jgi:hypothetical protein
MWDEDMFLVVRQSVVLTLNGCNQLICKGSPAPAGLSNYIIMPHFSMDNSGMFFRLNINIV